MKVRAEEQIRHELISLRKQAKREFGPHADISILASILHGKVGGRLVELSSAVFDAYSTPDLVRAAEINAELDELEKASPDGGEH